MLNSIQKSIILIVISLLFTAGIRNPSGIQGNDNTSGNSAGKKSKVVYIKRVYQSGKALKADTDQIEWYTGKDALKEYLKDNPSKRKEMRDMESLPEGYYIRNKSRAVSAIRISDKVEIIMQTFHRDSTGQYMHGEKITLKSLRDIFPDKKNSASRFVSKPMRLEITNGVITRIEEQYIP